MSLPRASAVMAIAFAACVLMFAFFPMIAHAQNAHAQVVLDPNFRTPAPPNDAYPQNAEHVFVATGVMLAIALVFMLFAALDARRFKSTIPLAIVAASAFCVVPESVDNYLAGCYWTQSHDPAKILYFLMGREFDYYVAIMWWAFGAILGYILYAVLLREVKTGTLWKCLALSGVADIVLEEILLGYGGIYKYFGHQPLVLISRFPWWWLFVNVSAIFITIAIAYRFREWFNGWKSVFILALMPLCYIGGFAFAAMPAIFVIQGDFSPLVTQSAGILTSILAIIQVGAVMYIVLGRNPFDLGTTDADPAADAARVHNGGRSGPVRT